MNLETGVFTSLTSGHYTLTLSGYSALDARVDNYLDLYHNGQMVPVLLREVVNKKNRYFTVRLTVRVDPLPPYAMQ